MPPPRPTEPALKFRKRSWYIEYWDGPERRRISTGTADEKGARQALADFETRLAHSPLNLTFGEALDRYEAARNGKVVAFRRLQDCSKSLKSKLGPLRVDQIDQRQWDKYVANRSRLPHRSGRRSAGVAKPISSSTLRREFNVLRAALRLAWRDGFLLKPPTIEPPAETAPRDRYLTKDQARALLDACKTPHVRVFVALAVYTGGRKGSILALTWNQVDFRSGMIDLQEPGRVLTKKRRSIVPMTEDLQRILRDAYFCRQSEWVVEYNGNPVPFGLRWSFKKLCVSAGIGWTPTPHILKHSVASWMAMDRVPIDQAADWLATDPKTLRQVYRKFDPAYLRPVASSLAL